jgi:hypothetical protein
VLCALRSVGLVGVLGAFYKGLFELRCDIDLDGSKALCEAVAKNPVLNDLHFASNVRKSTEREQEYSGNQAGEAALRRALDLRERSVDLMIRTTAF